MNIGNFKLGDGKIFLVAELSANHGGNFETVVKTIEAAKDAGADGIKLQTYTPDTMTLNIQSPNFMIQNGSLWDGETYYDLYKKAAMPWDWQPKLKKIADKLGLILFSSPFDKSAVDFLEKLDVPAYKIASFEITDLPLIKYAASKGKPMVISTGIAEFNEIKTAVSACMETGNNNIVLLKCTSSYPAAPEDANLLNMKTMMNDFHLPVGFSDHTTNNISAIIAAALGAVIIEKHFILDKSIDSPDKDFSITPQEFKILAEQIRQTEKILGLGNYKLAKSSLMNKRFSRGLYAIKNIKKGELFTVENIASLRPAAFLSPTFMENIIGKTSKTDIKKGESLTKSMF